MFSNITHPNPASLDSINGTMNSSPLHLSLNFNNNGSMSSRWIVPNSTPEVHQNDLILQKSSFTADLGQLGLSQVGHSEAVTEVWRTCISAKGMQVRTVLDHPSVQTHSVSVSYTSKVITLTKVIRTTNLNSPLSTMNQIMHQNGGATLQIKEPVVGEWFDNMSNQVNTFHHANPYPQFNNAMATMSNQITCEMQLSQFNQVQPSLTSHNTPISLHAIGSMDSDMMQNVSCSQLQMVKMDTSGSNQKIDPTLVDTGVKDKQIEDPHYDGITHSFPYQKYGPYTCPRCRKVFDRSQAFAAHMTIHYKFESPAEKKRRQAAKYKHRYSRKIDATKKKFILDPQTELTLAAKMKEEVENPEENCSSAII